MNLFSPDGVSGYEEIRPIDQAVMLKEYLTQIEAEETRVKALIDGCCSMARDAGETDTDGWKLVVKYASGIASKPDISMLRAEYPERYQALVDAQIKAYKPTLAKSDLDWLFGDVPEVDREPMVSAIMVEHPVRTQYILQAKREGSE